jgi:hypothetical protein
MKNLQAINQICLEVASMLLGAFFLGDGCGVREDEGKTNNEGHP